jgi:hypothetical protein
LQVKRRKGEVITLYCSGCSWSTELAMADTETSRVVPCAHCGKSLYWHVCEQCGLKYVGAAEKPACPICDDDSLDSLDGDESKAH